MRRACSGGGHGVSRGLTETTGLHWAFIGHEPQRSDSIIASEMGKLWCAILGLNQFNQFADFVVLFSANTDLTALIPHSTTGAKRKQAESSVLSSGHNEVMT